MSENANRGRLRPLLSGVVLRSQTDQRLCALAAAGHHQAFNVIFERYRRELCSHAARIVRPDRADDVVQQAMLGAWTTLVSGPRIADLRPWLHRVVHNAALDTVGRRGYDDGELPASSTAPSLTDELVEGRLRATAALAALAALPENQRRALTLTAIEGRSGHEAAQTMGVSESAMRQLVHRARSGVRAAASAITPLPLVNWLLGTGASAGPAAVGLAGGGAATAAKVIAVIGVTATIGVTHTLPSHRLPGPARKVPTRQATTSAPDPGRAGVAVQQVALVKPAKEVRQPTAPLPAPAHHAAGDERGSAQAGQTTDGADHRSAPHNATDSAGDQGSTAQPSSPDGAPGSGGGQPDAAAPDQAASGTSAADRSDPQRAAETSSGQSGADGSLPSPDANAANAD